MIFKIGNTRYLIKRGNIIKDMAKKPNKKHFGKNKKEKQEPIASHILTGWSGMDKAFSNLRKDFDELKKDFERTFWSLPAFDSIPLPKISSTVCDLEDEGNRFLVRAELPGIKRNEINLNITENAVEIIGEHKEEKEDKKKNYIRKERNQVSYHRTLSLPERITTDKVQAKLKDGILVVSLPKLKPKPKLKKKTISVQ